MNRITRLSLALIMFSLFSISYLMSSVNGGNAPCYDVNNNPISCDAPASDATATQDHATSGAAITGSDSVVCDGLSTKRQETNCLRDVLDDSPYAVAKKEGQQRGNYGCGNSDRATHTGCLRDILHQGDNTLAPGTN